MASRPVIIAISTAVMLTGANLTGRLPPTMFSALPDLTILFLGSNPGELVHHNYILMRVPH